MKKKKIKLPKWIAILLTFQFTNIVFAMFRANSVSEAISLYKAMFGLTYLQIPKGIMHAATIKGLGFTVGQYMNNDQNLNLIMIIICLFIVFKARNSMERMKDFNPTKKLAVWCGFMFVLSLFGINRVSDFIYFNF